MARVTLDWLNVIALLGAIQGVFLAVVLASKRRNRTANRLLAVSMLTFSVYLASSAYHAADLVDDFPHFFGFAYPLPLLFGPLIYMYAVTAADRSRRLTWRDALHLAPFAALIIAAAPIYAMSGPEKVAFYQRLQDEDVPLLLMIADPLKLISGVVYTIATVGFLRLHRERVKESYSSTERVNLQWLLWLAGGAALIWLFAVTLQVLEGIGALPIERGEGVITLSLAALVYFIGYRGLRQPEIFRFQTAEFQVPRELLRGSAGTSPDPAVAAEPAAADPDSPRYQRSGLTERQAQRLKDALLRLMDDERPWQDSELTLAELATRLDTTPHKLSEVLNAQLGVTFYDFVNGYRVREVQRRIAAGEAHRVKMLTIAMDAGFASKSTFNLVFKKHTNQTPSDYRETASA